MRRQAIRLPWWKNQIADEISAYGCVIGKSHSQLAAPAAFGERPRQCLSRRAGPGRRPGDDPAHRHDQPAGRFRHLRVQRRRRPDLHDLGLRQRRHPAAGFDRRPVRQQLRLRRPGRRRRLGHQFAAHLHRRLYRPLFHRRRGLSRLRPDRPIHARRHPAAADRRGRFDLRQRRPDHTRASAIGFIDSGVPDVYGFARRDRHLQDHRRGRQGLHHRGRRRRRLCVRLSALPPGELDPLIFVYGPDGSRSSRTTTSASRRRHRLAASASSRRRAAPIFSTSSVLCAVDRRLLDHARRSSTWPTSIRSTAINWFSRRQYRRRPRQRR